MCSPYIQIECHYRQKYTVCTFVLSLQLNTIFQWDFAVSFPFCLVVPDCRVSDCLSNCMSCICVCVCGSQRHSTNLSVSQQQHSLMDSLTNWVTTDHGATFFHWKSFYICLLDYPFIPLHRSKGKCVHIHANIIPSNTRLVHYNIRNSSCFNL